MSSLKTHSQDSGLPTLNRDVVFVGVGLLFIIIIGLFFLHANDGEGSWRRVLSNAEGVESVVILFDK